MVNETFKDISLTLLTPEGSYNTYIIPFERVSSDEFSWISTLHKEGQTIMDPYDSVTLKRYQLVQLRMNFISTRTSVKQDLDELKQLQFIYQKKWGHEYQNVGKWNQFLKHGVKNVLFLRSSYPIEQNRLTIA